MMELKIVLNKNIDLNFAKEISNICYKYESGIHIKFNNGIFNAKSVLSILSIPIKNNEEFLFIFDGKDEQIAYNTINNYFLKNINKENI